MIAVVGGGITGLATGFELDRVGADFVILESSGRPGGVIRSEEVEGRVLDWGPQRARMTASFRRLVEELDLASEIVTAPPGLELFVFRDGRLRAVPFSVAGFVMSDVVGWGSKLRALLEPFTAEARPEEPVADFFTRKFGREMYETIIGPLYGGLYASDPASMRVGLSLIHVLREFSVGRSLLLRLFRRGGRIAPPPACSFRGGMQVLPDALGRSLGDRFRAHARVRELARTGAGWRVTLESGQSVEATDVVLTAPAPVTAGLLEPVAPQAASAIARLRYNPLAVVHLEAETDLRGIGFKVSFTEPDMTLSGVTFNDALFGRQNLYTAYLGGARHPDVETMDPDELAMLAIGEFRECTGYEARVLSVERERMPAWDLSWSAVQALQVPEGLHLAGNWWSRPGLPGRLAEAASLTRALTRDPTGASPALQRRGTMSRSPSTARR